MKGIAVNIQGLVLLFLIQIKTSYDEKNIKGSNIINIDKSIFTDLKYKGEGKNFETLKKLSLLIIGAIFICHMSLYNSINSKAMPLGISIMDGLIKITSTKLIFILFILLLSWVIISTISNHNQDKDNGCKKEQLILLQTNILGINIIIFSNDWLLTIISWELFNKTLYLFVSLKSENEAGLAASLKYFVLSALSTTFLFLGVSILYYKTGSTNYEIIDTCINELLVYKSKDSKIVISYILILSTIIFKLSGAPFHLWAPDLYANIHTNYTQWMIIIPKLTILAFLFIIADVFSIFLELPSINLFLLISGSLSIFIGSFALNNQWYIKRLFAFSGISHVGFMLLSLYCHDIQSYLIYAFIYGVTTMNIFSILIQLSILIGREIKDIKDITGIFKVNKTLSLLFALNIFSLAGVCQLKILRIIRTLLAEHIKQ